MVVPPRTATIPGPVPDYGARAARLLDLYFTRIPDSLEIDRLTIHSAFDDIHQALYIPRLAIQGPVLDTALEVYDQGEKWVCLLDGKIERHLEFGLHVGRQALDQRNRDEGYEAGPCGPSTLPKAPP